MKKVLLAALGLLLGAQIFSQTSELDRLYDTYRGKEDVVSIYVPGFACRLAANLGEMEAQDQELLRSIRSVRIQVVENNEINRTVNYARLCAGMNPERGYLPMLEVHDKDQDVLILARQKEEEIRELIILVGGEQNAMVWVKGRMDHDLMKNLFEATGIEQLRFTKEI